MADAPAPAPVPRTETASPEQGQVPLPEHSPDWPAEQACSEHSAAAAHPARARHREQPVRRRLATEQEATEAARQQAEANAQGERQAIRNYFLRAAEDPAWKAVGLEPLRRKLLEEARTYLQGFLRTHGEEPELLAELAEAHARLGQITGELGDRQQACAELEAALGRRADGGHTAPSAGS